MKNVTRNHWVLIAGGVCLLLGVGSGLFSTDSPDVPRRIYFRTGGGDVLFTHEAHSRMKNVRCEDCHHERLDPDNRKSCATCHDDEGYSPEDMSHAELIDAHNHSCTSCHGTREHPLHACRACHGKTGGGAGNVSCERCHPDEGLSPADFTHTELEGIEGHWCNECHRPRSVTDAIHGQCNLCHLKLKHGKYIGNTSGKESYSCRMCHLSFK